MNTHMMMVIGIVGENVVRMNILMSLIDVKSVSMIIVSMCLILDYYCDLISIDIEWKVHEMLLTVKEDVKSIGIIM